MAQWRILFASIALAVSTQMQAAEMPFRGANCGLSKPPAQSGEENLHGGAVKIFPRKKDVGPSYVGCLIVWAPAETGLGILGVTYIENGVAIAFWSPADGQFCKYQSEKPVEPASNCPMYRFLTPRSMPVGCVGKKMKAGGNVPGCEYE